MVQAGAVLLGGHRLGGALTVGHVGVALAGDTADGMATANADTAKA